MSDILSRDHRIDSSETGHTLLLRNKRRSDRTAADPARTVLFCHGATYASSLTFDYAVDGVSWMDLLARAGFDVWAIDLLGYGGSDRPAAMDEDPSANAPLVDTDAAVADLHRALDHVLRHGSLPRCHLIGYSWGTILCGRVAAARPDDVDRLVLYGAVWRASGESIRGSGPVGAYRTVTAEAMTSRWTLGLSAEEAEAVASPEAMRTWAEAVLASDLTASDRTPPSLRAPAGVVKDVVEGAFAWDPGAIRAPTLVVVADRDQETTPGQGRSVFERLTHAAERRYLLIGGGTHALLLERQRHQLQHAVEAFLKESRSAEE